jgi:mono/diheme cytochrome c family protein
LAKQEPRVHRLALLLVSVALAACATESPQGEVPAERGRQIAATHCASCHAIGAAGESPAPEAPPFRLLSRNYRVDALEEALAEGISVGHPAMPEFQFEPDDVTALVQYLQSIQADQGDVSG